MLYIDKATILKFDLEMLKKHRRAIQFIAVLLFIVGLLCISFPFVSGDILSTVVGALLICSGIALIVGLFSNRSHNFWPVLSGFLVAVAYCKSEDGLSLRHHAVYRNFYSGSFQNTG
ncbi:putative transport system permease domain protein [Escherichia coli FRIK1990]|nr:putative transport system permease domain protein [Escherichia coli FRIK1990]